MRHSADRRRGDSHHSAVACGARRRKGVNRETLMSKMGSVYIDTLNQQREGEWLHLTSPSSCATMVPSKMKTKPMGRGSGNTRLNSRTRWDITPVQRRVKRPGRPSQSLYIVKCSWRATSKLLKIQAEDEGEAIDKAMCMKENLGCTDFTVVGVRNA